MAGIAAAKGIANAVSDSDNPSEVLYLVACHFLSQLEHLLQTSVVTDYHLTFTSKLSPGSTIGKHIRHLVDHYRLLLEGLKQSNASSSSSSSSSQSPLLVDYDVRTRNQEAETSHAACLESVRILRDRIAQETGEGKSVDPERIVRLKATTPVQVEVGTTFARELWFASFHAVHHFALLRVIATGELGLDVAKDFGVAPSTLVHRQEDKEESKGLSKL
ncbi:hypothetical protein JCM10296v2_001327 [Rhodotorula toruloides]